MQDENNKDPIDLIYGIVQTEYTECKNRKARLDAKVNTMITVYGIMIPLCSDNLSISVLEKIFAHNLLACMLLIIISCMIFLIPNIFTDFKSLLDRQEMESFDIGVVGTNNLYSEHPMTILQYICAKYTTYVYKNNEMLDEKYEAYYDLMKCTYVLLVCEVTYQGIVMYVD